MTDQPTNTAAVKALCKAQAQMTSAKKGADNPHFSSKYADLAAVQAATYPALHSNGFAIMQPVGRADGEYTVTTIFAHESGAKFECPVPLIVDKSNMQAFKSANTYARRIGLENLSGVACEDDDGNKAADNPPKRPTAQNIADTFCATAEDVNREIKKISTIDDMDELASYWKVLNKAQPSVAANIDVRVAKDDRKSVISGDEK